MPHSKTPLLLVAVVASLLCVLVIAQDAPVEDFGGKSTPTCRLLTDGLQQMAAGIEETLKREAGESTGSGAIKNAPGAHELLYFLSTAAHHNAHTGRYEGYVVVSTGETATDVRTKWGRLTSWAKS